MAVGVVAAIAGGAFADNLDDSLAASSTNTYSPTINEGASFSTTVDYQIQKTGSNNVNFSPNPAVSFALSGAPSWVHLSATSLTFSDYTDVESLTVSGTAPTGSGGAAYSFTVVPSTTAASLVVAPAQVSMTVTVNTPVVTDTTAPAIAFTQSPDGNNNWFKTAPATVTVTATDADDNVSSIDCTLDGTAVTLSNTSGIGSAKTASGDISTSTDGNHTVSCTATDSHSNTTSPAATTHLKLDTDAPTITDTGFVSGTAGTNGWYTSAVTNGFSASDTTSGLADCSAPFSKSSGTSEGSAVKINSGSCSDSAGNTNNGIDSAGYKIDLSNPTNVAFVGGPADGGSYYFGFVPAAPTCTADDAISGLASCVVTGYSSAVGSHTLTATATDNAGRTATATRNYTVLAWTLNGFYQPVDMSGSTTVWNTVKNGSTVPLKFEIFAGSTELTDTADVKSLTYIGVTCSLGDPQDAIELTSTGGTTLRYDTTAGQFVYNWQTPKKSGACYMATVEMQDGSKLSAYFMLK